MNEQVTTEALGNQLTDTIIEILASHMDHIKQLALCIEGLHLRVSELEKEEPC